jgi:MFS family permease
MASVAQPAVPSGRGLRALHNPNYRIYFFGQLVSQIGTWLQRIGQAWLVLDLTNSSTDLGIVTALQFLPIMLLSLVGGVIADRFPKRQMMFAIQSVATLQALVLAVLTLSGQIQLWHVYVLAVVLGVVSAFDMPVRQAFMGEIAGREDLQSAISLNSSVFNGARIIGPGIGGVIIAVWGVGWCFALNAVSFLAVLVSLALLRADRFFPLRRPARAPLWKQLGDGLRYVAGKPQLTFPLLLLAVIGTFGYNFGVSLPLLARYTLDVGSVGFGTLNAVMGVGSVIGALGVAAHVAPSQRGLLVAGGGFAVCLLALALVPWYLAALGVLFVLGIVSITYSASTNTTLQLNSREEYRGRVLSLYTLLFAGSTPIGGALTGWMADRWGIDVALAVEAGVCLLAVLVGALYVWSGGLGGLRQLRAKSTSTTST